MEPAAGDGRVRQRAPMTALFLFRRFDCDNGITTYFETIMRGLKDAGDKIVVVTGPVTVTPATRQRLENLMALADEWQVLPTIGRFEHLHRSVKFILPIARRANIDLFCPQGFKMLPLARLLTFLTAKPAVVVFHGGAASHVGRQGSLKERIYYALTTKLFAAEKFIAMSSEASEFMRKTCGIALKRIVSIPNGVDTGYFRPPAPAEKYAARAAFNLPQTGLVCILSGRVSIDKGHKLAVEALRHLRLSNPEMAIICLFAGSTAHSHGAEIMAWAQHNDADREAFRFLGFIGGDLLRNAYWASDITLLPSQIEGFGIAVAEAMACGCVPIRTPAGGCSDQIIDGVTGFVVPFEDSHAIADRLVILNDAKRLDQMRHAARAHVVANFSKEQMIARTAQTYQTACRGV